jgi:hypothetical protein
VHCACPIQLKSMSTARPAPAMILIILSLGPVLNVP